MKKNSIAFILALVLISAAIHLDSFADIITDVLKFDDSGSLTFITTDTKASTTTKYKTVGFTIFNSTRTQSVVLQLEEKSSLDLGNGMVETTFVTNRDTIYERIGEVDEAWQKNLYKNGGNLYLDGVFTINSSGSELGGLSDEGRDDWGEIYYTLSGIKNARAWADPSSLDQYFNKQIYFAPHPELLTGKIYIHNFTDTGVPLQQYDTEIDVINDQTYTVTNSTINGYNFTGSKIGYGSIPTGSMGSSTNYTINYDGTKSKIYVYFYYAHQSSSIGENGMNASPTTVIRADDRGSEVYDSTKGIPSGEDLYVNVLGKSYLYDYDFLEKVGTKSYTVEVSKTYNLSWMQDDGGNEPYTWYHDSSHYCEDQNGDGVFDSCPGHVSTHWVSDWQAYSDTETVTNSYEVARDYSYWIINNLAVYGLDKAVVNNTSLPDGSVTLIPNGYTEPMIDTWHSNSEADHIVEPVSGTTTITLATSTLDGGYSGRPSIPAENWYSDANSSIEQIKVKNDKLLFNDQTVMTDALTDYNTQDPGAIPVSATIDNNTLYKKDLTIDVTKANGTFTSTGLIYYTRLPGAINPTITESYTQNISGINSVVVHTPVVCDGGIISDNGFNQELTLDTTRATVVLGKSTYFRLITSGQHKNILGYGNRDYEAFATTKQVRFPFDIYMNTTTADKTKFVAANTWYDVPLSQDEVHIYVPTWVEEGDYTVDYRTIAINAPNTTSVEKNANLEITHYVATDSSPIHVVGRLYGFKITDIENYPLWETVFKTKAGSATHTSTYYYSGLNNQDGTSLGITDQYVLPIMEGSHPTVKNQAIPTGYTFKFELETIGDYNGDFAAINIIPKFYYVSEDGENKQEVDLYYSNEYFDGKTQYFVKVDNNTLNRKNAKYCSIGDADRDVPTSAIKNTATYLGLTESAFKSQNAKLGYFDFIVLPDELRTFVGNTTNLPAGVSTNSALTSVQHWYGEYYMPNDLYVATKGYDVVGYSRTNNGLDGKESFWLKGGYIVVGFEIQTHKDIKTNAFANPVLSYENGIANMWQIEGYDITQTDSNGVDFTLDWGDIAFYYTNYKSTDDYDSNGTH